MPQHTATHLSPELQRCVDECLHCFSICEQTLSHCLVLGGRHAEPAHLKLLMDCASICRTSADFMLRGSDSHARICAICAEICQACAEDCERVDAADQLMKECAAQCRSCADSCDRMAHAG